MRWIPALALLPIASAQDQPAALPKTLPGWKLQVVAQVPDLHYPTVVCCSPDGRIFVAEDPMDMTGPVDVPSDRILCLHPDGRTTVFADKLFAVFGLKYIDGKLYVHHTPRFRVFTDDAGVGRDRVDLIECTNPKPWAAPPPGDLGFNDHIPSNCTLAMDGRLYVSTGDKGIFGAAGRDGSRLSLRQKRDTFFCRVSDGEKGDITPDDPPGAPAARKTRGGWRVRKARRKAADRCGSSS